MATAGNEDINLHEIPVQALRWRVRERLACMLNKRKLILSPEGFCRDYRGLAELMELCIDYCWTPNNNPIMNLLERSRHSLADLQIFLERIDRFDVLDDNRDLFYEDAVAYHNQKNLIVPALRPNNEEDFLTVDDILESRITYDAFLLYMDADVEFAIKIIKTMESEYNLRICVKDRLLGGSVFEHSAIMKLISQRCRRLIVLLSNEFVSSDKDTFFLEFAQFLSLEMENKKRFIIPVKYKPCNLPEHYLVYFILDYMRHGMITNFWERLNASILPAPEEPTNGACITELPQSIKQIRRAIQDNSDKKNKREETNCLPTSSPTKVLTSVQNTQPEVISNTTRRKTVRAKLSKLFKRMSKGKPKLAQAEAVACAS